MLDVRRLEMLLEVGRRGSFAAAAEALSFTPSAVSQQMCALERATRVLLFERGARGVQLTDAGRVLCQHAEAVTAQLAQAEADLDVLGGLCDSRLRFGSFSSATGAFAAEAFRLFAERHPDSERTFSDGEPYESVAALAAGELDLAVIFEFDEWPAGMDYHGATVSRDARVESVLLFEDPYLLVLPADHELAVEHVIAVDRLSDQRILVAAPWHRDLEKAWREAGAHPELSCCRATGFEALQALVSIGHGLTLMPRLALGWLREGLVARPIETAPVRYVKTAVPAKAPRSSASRAMLKILIALTETRGPSTAIGAPSSNGVPPASVPTGSST